MPFWIIAAVIASLLIAYKAIPKPQSMPPAGLNEFKVPTAEEGREIPVLFGTRVIESPNIVWYGDVSTVAIRKKGGKK